MSDKTTSEWASDFKEKIGELTLSESTRQILLQAVDQAAVTNILLLISRHHRADLFSLGNRRLDFEDWIDQVVAVPEILQKIYGITDQDVDDIHRAAVTWQEKNNPL